MKNVGKNRKPVWLALCLVLLTLILPGCPDPVNNSSSIAPAPPPNVPGVPKEPEEPEEPDVPDTAVPGGFTAAPVLTAGDMCLEVTWEAVENATSYDVYYAQWTASAPEPVIAAYEFMANTKNRNYIVRGLTNGQQYAVRIRGRNGENTGGLSPVGTGTPAAPPPPPVLSLDVLAAFLDEQPGGGAASNPIAVQLSAEMQLHQTNWINLCTLLGQKKKYVTLDLTNCVKADANSGYGLRSNGTFDARVGASYPTPPDSGTPADVIAGQGYVVELILPDAATTLLAGSLTLGTTNDFSNFSGFGSLKKLTGRNVTTIEDRAFSMASYTNYPKAVQIEEIILPNAESMGSDIFSFMLQDPVFKYLTLGKNLQSIGARIFGPSLGNYNITISLAGSGGAQVFGGKAVMTATGSLFFAPSKDERYDVDLSGTSLTGEQLLGLSGNSASNSISNAGLRSIILPSTVAALPVNSFRHCPNLTSVTLPPSGLTSIGTNTFNECPASLVFSGGGVYFEGKIVAVGAPGNKSIYRISSGLSGTVDLGEISGLASLGSIKLGSQPGLTGIIVPQGFTAIPASFAASCPNLQSVTLPSSLTTIGATAFTNCAQLQSLTLPSGLTSIGAAVFDGCTNLTLSGGGGNFTVELSGKALTGGQSPNKNILWISPSRLTGIVDLGSISGLAAIIGIGSSSAPNTAVTGIIVPEGVTALPQNFARYCPNLASVTLPSTLTTIGAFAFQDCAKLQSVTLPSRLAAGGLGTDAFRGCHANLTFSGGGAEAGGKVLVTGTAENKTLLWVVPGVSGHLDLSQISGLKTLVFLSSSPNAGAPQYTGITSITIPEGVTDLPSGFATNCPNLASINLPLSLTTINRWAFQNTALISITIPAGVVAIGDHTAESTRPFAGCTKLREVISLRTSPPVIQAANPFADCDLANLVIRVPAESVAAYKAAAKWSTYAAKIVAIVD